MPPTASTPLYRRPVVAWLVALLFLAGCGYALYSARLPQLPGTIELRVTFAEGQPGLTEPFISTGITYEGDFLAVRYLDANTAVFNYDSWSSGGPDSAPFSLEPGKPRSVHVTMPSLDGGPRAGKRVLGPLRIVIDGREIAHASVPYFSRTGEQIFFGNNPIGGNTGGGLFRGTIQTPDGRTLAGQPFILFSPAERFSHWVKTYWSEVVALIVFSLIIGLVQPRFAAWLDTKPWQKLPVHSLSAHGAPPHVAFAVTSLVCVAVFIAVMTGGTFRMITEESFGTFFDHQAAAILNGRLDVPEPALSGEAFVVDGKVYGYYGVMPALLRLPFVGFEALFGQMSRIAMVLYYLACLTGAYSLLVHFTRFLCGPQTWPSRLATVLFIGTVGLGTSLFFLGSRAYVYHECILCGAAFALWSAYFTLRFVEEPGRRWWFAALVTGLCAVQARPPAGLFALVVLGTAAGWHLLLQWSERRLGLRYALIGLGSVAAILSFNGMSWLKFRTFDGSPFKYAVQYTAERRARFDNKNFHATNFGHNFDVYVRLPDFGLQRHFPWFVFDSSGKRPQYPRAKIDLEEPALAMPYAMPALFFLALLGGGWALCFAPSVRQQLTIVAIGSTPMCLALSMAIVTSHRYTADFCALLIVFGAAGLAVLDAEKRRHRTLALSATAVLAAASIFATLALSVRFQGELVWGVPDDAKRNYEALRTSADKFFGVTPKSANQ